MNGFTGEGVHGEQFRVWLFQPNLVNNEALVPFTYSSTWYFNPAYAGEQGNPPFDTSYININIIEWQAELPTAKTADAYKLLYNTEPNTYRQQVKGDSLRQNSFYQVLKDKPELLSYFNFAKECESAFVGGNYSNDWVWQKDSIAIRRLVPKAEGLLKTAKSPFVRLRTAYQLIKAYEYLANTEGGIKTFNAHIKDSKSKSWIIGSAMYYYAKVQKTLEAKYLAAANCFDQTIDKKRQILNLIPTELRRTTIPKSATVHQRATLTAMIAVRYPGPALDDMLAIYAAEPIQNELPMLIEREINKLEDWLLTYSFSRRATGIAYERNTLKEEAQDGMNWEVAEEKKYQANWKLDRLYLDKVAAFVDKVIAEKKVKDPAFVLLCGAHLAFLKQDFNKTRQYLAALKTEKNVKPNIRVQAELTNVLADLYEKPQITQATEQKIVAFETILQKSQKDIIDFKTFREQIYLFLGKKFIDYGQISKGCLLTMKTKRFTKEIGQVAYENGYHRLYGLAKPADFDETLRILTKPQTAFEHLLADEKCPYWTSSEWNINKIRDYKASYYIRNDQIDSALAVVKTIPRTYWSEEPYSTYLDSNPFFVDVVNPHSETFADSIRYNKIMVLEKMVKLKKEAQKNPSASAYNFYLLGNAYYNMSWYGNYWLMSDICWTSYQGYSNYFDKDEAFLNSYFGLERARKQYELCLQNTKDEKLAALCHYMIGFCTKTKVEYQFYKTHNRWGDPEPKPPTVINQSDDIFKKKFPNRLQAYRLKDYWCTKGNYEKMIKLYSGL